MITVPVPSAMVALTGVLNVMVNRSATSAAVSLLIGTTTFFTVWPGAKDRVPVVAVKSVAGHRGPTGGGVMHRHGVRGAPRPAAPPNNTGTLTVPADSSTTASRTNSLRSADGGVVVDDAQMVDAAGDGAAGG